MSVHVPRANRGFWHYVIPYSGWGWWSVALTCAFFLFAALVPIAIAPGLETTDFAPAVVIPMGLAVISGGAAMVAGVVSITLRKERSVLVLVSVLIGVAVTAIT